MPLKVGSRALDILIVLLEHAPDVVSKRDLMRRVWAELVVDEGSLRVHIAALRKALGEGESGAHYITNVPSRGYCFAAPVAWTEAPTSSGSGTPSGLPPHHLPRRPLQMVGRDEVVAALTSQLREHRFVSIVGAGGIGKTTAALAVTHDLLRVFPAPAYFLDLAALTDARLVPGALASQLGLSVVSGNFLPAILSFLREQRALIVFDSCEHVVGAVAVITEQIFREAPGVYILATSREALRAQGEQVHHLPPLECPPSDAEALTAAGALTFPAVRLFVKQIAAGGHLFELGEGDVPLVCEICRRLDGIPLALELAASRVAVFGVQGTAALLNRQFNLLWSGRRTAIPRHQTLSATLDWSHNLLSPTEQVVLRRLAIFVGSFSLESALDIAAMDLDEAEVTEALATLVEKSLVSLDSSAAMRYRLLDTTRAYATQKLSESGERQEIARRHCEHTVRGLEPVSVSVTSAAPAGGPAYFAANLGNVRAALDWSFSDHGDGALALRLAAASVGYFFRATLLLECITWSERALAALDIGSRGTWVELEARTCLAMALHMARGSAPTVEAAIQHALQVADALNDAQAQLLLLSALYRWQYRTGDFTSLAAINGRFAQIASQLEDPLAGVVIHAAGAITCFYVGDPKELAAHARMALDETVHSSKLNAAAFGYLHRVGVRAVLMRNLWLEGYADQAAASTGEMIEEALDLGNPLTIAFALVCNALMFLSMGDWAKAEELLHRLAAYTARHQLLIYSHIAAGLQGLLAVMRGDLSDGIDSLRTTLSILRTDGYEVWSPQLALALAEGLARAGQPELAYTTICEWLVWAEARSRKDELPELLRVKGELLHSRSPADATESDECLLKALRLAQGRSSLALELRAATSLARTWADRGQSSRALELLEPIYARFSEGLGTRDLMAASRLIGELRART